MDDYLQRIYFTPGHPASFAGQEKLYRFVKQDGKFNLSKSDIRNWLQSVESYTLHREAKRKFPRNRVQVTGIGKQWDCDLIDLSGIFEQNDSFKYVLLCIDVFSRYVWVQPLKSKKGVDVAKAFETIFKGSTPPLRARSDKGGEFKNRLVKQVFKKFGVLHMVTQNTEVKAALAERAIKTLKLKMYRYFTHKQTHRYIDKLQDFANSYNATYHRSIKMKPSQVNEQNEKQLWFDQYALPMIQKPPKQHKPKLKPGDLVRMTYIKQKFDREYDQRWTGELFRVKKINWMNRIPVYSVKDFHNSDILGNLYENELQKVHVDEDHPYKIDRILKTRKRKGIKQYHVSFQFWPPSFNAWINASDMENI